MLKANVLDGLENVFKKPTLFQSPKHEPEILGNVQERLSTLEIQYDSVQLTEEVKKFCKNVERILFYHLVLVLK